VSEARVGNAILLQARLRQAEALHQQGMLADAETICDEILRQQPSHFGALHLSGVLALQTQRAERGVALIATAVELNPGAAAAYRDLGSGLFALNRLEEAIASYDKAIALEPDDAQAHNNRGNALRGLRRHDAALASYDEAIALRPDFAEAHNNRGNTLGDLGRHEAALASYDTAIALRPDYAQAHNNRGNTLSDLGRCEAALASYDTVTALRPDYAPAHYNRGNVLLDLRRYAEALASYDKVIALRPDLAEAHSNRGIALAELWRYEEALVSYDKAIALNPGVAETHYNRGNALRDLGRDAAALASYDKAIALEPANPAFRDGLANALVAAGQPEAAAATYAAGIEAAPCSLALRNAAILLAVHQRDFATAVALAEATCAAGIADGATFGLKGHALSGLGRHAEAVNAYADALKAGPEDPPVPHMVDATDLRPGATRTFGESVRRLFTGESVRREFDGLADRYEGRLIGLGYQVPELMRNVLRAHLPIDAGGTIGPVLDLGCGTGLAAAALAELPLGPWEGVDLSPRMLRLAAAKRLYAALHHADIIDFLAGDVRQWRLILAADVLCYLGALEPLLAAVYARLLPGALFAGSVEEKLPGLHGGSGDWVLGPRGRFVHEADYIGRAARTAGFAVRAIDAKVLRQELGEPVQGLLFVLERPHAIG